MKLDRSLRTVLLTGGLALAGCGDAPSSSDATTTSVAATSTPATTTPANTAISVTSAALQLTDSGYSVDWTALTNKPFFALSVHLDSFFHIHTDPKLDGFFLSFELYTTFGSQWSGELGTFDIGCGAASTGICVHFDPDGPGPLGDLGADYAASGTITINALDETQYDIAVDVLTFTDGTAITGLHLVGTA
ncbi:MAG: hypothetical protein HY826_04425 [Actinobacteria bacterium]|nr:hypothetical protein [Actinomycetota bacterium]